MRQLLKYRTYGHFYKNDDGKFCRKYVDIKADGEEVANPQLVILMLHPGSCREREGLELGKDVEVQPDPALKRVQNFMQLTSLKWVRVLNLSDMEEPSRNIFFKKIGAGNADDLPKHSILHPSRREELIQIAKGQAPFLLAWGDDPRSGKLGNTALLKLREEGLPIINEHGPYHHPTVRPGNKSSLWVDDAGDLYRRFVTGSAGEDDAHKQLKAEIAAQEALVLREKITTAFKMFEKLDFGNLIITKAKQDGRWNLFLNLLLASGIKPYHGTKDYDYLYTDHVANARAMYNLLAKHNGKKVIIDAAASPAILKLKGVLELLEQAVCCSTDNGERWKVGYELEVAGKHPFTFNGKIVLLMSQSEEELKSDPRFQHLVRDCVVV